MSSRFRRVAGGLLAAAVLVGIVAYSLLSRRTLYTTTWFDLFDTVAIVKGYARNQAEWDEQMEALHADLLHYHQLFDIYHHYDGMVNLYDVNAGAAFGPVTVSEELYDFLDWCAGTVYSQTDGATNIAAGSVLKLWHDARESTSPAPPDDARIEQALAHIAMDNLQLDAAARTVFFADPAMSLDVGAVGKGYAVEQAAEAAEARGLDSALLNIGGNLRAIGKKANNEGNWTAGVENPWSDDPAYIQTVTLQPGASLVVSGDYQRYFTYKGVRYSHLIDLTTGYPARYCNSAAVLAPADGGGLADALSTALFCLPEETGRALLPDGYQALWMYPDTGTTQTDGWTGQPTQ